MPELTEKRFWDDIWPIIFKSPVCIFTLIMTFLMGYIISFMIFDYSTDPRGHSHILHIAIGMGYTCLVFVVTSWPIIFSPNALTLDDLATYCPRTTVLGFAILIIVMIVVLVIRERKRN